MRLLTDAFEYNAWATRQLGNVCRQAPPEQLTGAEEWQYESIMGLLHHIDQVERAYLRLMGGRQVPEPPETVDGYLQSADAAGDSFVGFTKDIDTPALDRMFSIPWFERDFAVRDGLFQVLAHSIEHRADIAHFLSRLGHETPPIDYIAWVYVKDGGVMPG